MFCQKCGKKNEDTAVFCESCGSKINIEDENLEFKKSVLKTVEEIALGFGKYLLLMGVIIVVVGYYVQGDTDYVKTAMSYKPFDTINATLGEVLNTYIDDEKWDYNKSGGKANVTVEGVLKNTDKEIIMVIEVEPVSDEKVMISPKLTSIGNRRLNDKETAEFIYYMFYMYEDGEEDLSELVDYYN